MYPKEFIHFLVHFHCDRDYFECHEILEEYWKKTDPRNKQSIWVGFIQLAVSNYHYRRKNFAGAQKSIKKAMQIFFQEKLLISQLGLNRYELFSLLKDRLTKIEENQPYDSYNLPISDPLLLHQCTKLCEEIGRHWEEKSNLNDLQLVNRHLLRDRTDVIQARQNAKIKKYDLSNRLEKDNE